MGLFSALKSQFIEVIEWTEPGDGILAYRFPVHENEIKNGAQLTVRESQLALIVDQGTVADQFGPGRHVLATQNLPILTKLRSWPYGFNSPFKSEVYFFSTRQQLGQRWGTPQPVAVRDREFGSVMIRMFGIFSYHVSDPKVFYAKVSGTRDTYTADELNEQLLGHVAGATANAFAQSGVPFLDMAANQLKLGAALVDQLKAPFEALGVAVDTFVVESVSLPDELQKVLNDRQSMGILGDLGRYAQYEAARSIPDAVKNPGGLASLGAGVAAGVGIGGVMSQAFSGLSSPGPAGGSPGGGSGPAGNPAGSPGGPRNALAVACVACGKGIDADSPFCRFCGKSQTLSCPKCGTVSSGDAGFCAKCGTPLHGSPASP
jgi:membrane protease subunit (stomatin/prohibitin family)